MTLVASSTGFAAFARNPLKDSGSHGSNPPGSGTPNSSVFTFTRYVVSCGGPGNSTAQATLENKTINGHRQTFVHLGAQSPASVNGLPVASCQAVLSDPTLVQSPFKFQLLGGSALFVEVVYLDGQTERVKTFRKPQSILNSAITPLTNLGHNTYGIPIGSGSGEIPSTAVIAGVVFTSSAGNFCHPYDSDINNLVMGHTTSQIDTTNANQTCGVGCGD